MNESGMFQKADNFLDYVIVGAGLYLIYCALSMKITSRIPKSLVSRNIDTDNAPHRDEYISNMFLPSIVLGLILMLCGLSTWALPAMGVAVPEKTPMITSLVAMSLVILFGIFSMNMQKKYLQKD
ncbi:MAG: hypothetical protein IJS86_00580 [Lachnospiraceae bacterium]|nr:hypothetical protein [Lachnospiraceae bacterium]